MRVHSQEILRFLCATVFLTSGQAQTAVSNSASLTPAQSARVAQWYGQIPLAFEVNENQVDPQVKFLSRGAGYTLFLTPTEAVFALRQGLLLEPKSRTTRSPLPKKEEAGLLRLKLLSANTNAAVSGEEQLRGTSNYFFGNDPRQWRTSVRQFAKVRYAGVYRGVDLVYYGNRQELEYDFVLKPGADPGLIRIRIDGSNSLRLNHGDLVLRNAKGVINLRRPQIFQETDGGRRKIGGEYVIKGKNEVGFKIASYDRSRQLVIDPVLAYSSYLGGSNNSGGQEIHGIAVDRAGNAYVVGHTDSAEFPTANALQPTIRSSDAFVAKINADGTGLVYSTFLGGSSYEAGSGIAVDSAGDAFVSGLTYSTDFPIMNAIQPNYAGNGDVFITKINAHGDAIVYSTYLGGSGYDEARLIAVGPAGGAYVCGNTLSTDFPTVNAFQSSNGGGGDAFLTKIKANGNAFAYSTYLGGSADDNASDVAVDSSGNAYLTGWTASPNFPTINAFQPTNRSMSSIYDAFVAKFSSSGTALVYSTYLGGSGDDYGVGIAVDSSHNAYVAGSTSSRDFPTANPLQPANRGSANAFVTKIDPSGTTLVFSTYLGGSAQDGMVGIAVDPTGNVYLDGETSSTDFPTLNAIQPRNRGGYDATVSEINAAGNTLLFSTYLGGNKNDSGVGLALGSGGSVYLTLSSNSTNFLTTPAAFQPTWKGFITSGVAKLATQSFVNISQPTAGFYRHTVGTTSASIKRTLTNIGATSVSISRIYIVGANPEDFAETNNCGATLAAGAKCTISITFTPTATGARRGALVISDSDAASPQAVALMGTGG